MTSLEALRRIIIIPAYNEAGNLPRVIPEIRSNAPGFDLVVIGSSTGGPPVLEEILSVLPADFPAPARFRFRPGAEIQEPGSPVQVLAHETATNPFPVSQRVYHRVEPPSRIRI